MSFQILTSVKKVFEDTADSLKVFVALNATNSLFGAVDIIYAFHATRVFPQTHFKSPFFLVR